MTSTSDFTIKRNRFDLGTDLEDDFKTSFINPFNSFSDLGIKSISQLNRKKTKSKEKNKFQVTSKLSNFGPKIELTSPKPKSIKNTFIAESDFDLKNPSAIESIFSHSEIDLSNMNTSKMFSHAIHYETDTCQDAIEEDWFRREERKNSIIEKNLDSKKSSLLPGYGSDSFKIKGILKETSQGSHAEKLNKKKISVRFNRRVKVIKFKKMSKLRPRSSKKVGN